MPERYILIIIAYIDVECLYTLCRDIYAYITNALFLSSKTKMFQCVKQAAKHSIVVHIFLHIHKERKFPFPVGFHEISC